LTKKGPNSWATPFFSYNVRPGCEKDDVYNGITCDSSVQVRRVAFSGAVPSHKFSMRPAWIMKNDDELYEGMDKYERHAYGRL